MASGPSVARASRTCGALKLVFELIAALGAAALLTSLPGAFLLSLGPSWGPLSFRLACMPWVSVLILGLWARLLLTTTSNTAWWALSLPPLLLGVALWAAAAKGRTPTPFRVVSGQWWFPLTASIASLVMWSTLLLTGHNYPNPSVPMFDDGVRHGWFVARILNLGTLDAAVVTNVLPGGGSTDGSYPLGLHTLAASVVRLGGVSVASALDAVLMLAACIWLPLGAVAFWRLVYGSSARAATLPTAVLLAPSAFVMPFSFGDYPLIVATSGLLPLTAIGVLVVRGSSRSAVLAGLVAASVFTVHPTAALTGAICAGFLLAFHANLGWNAHTVRNAFIVLAVATAMDFPQLIVLLGTRGAGNYLEPALGLDLLQSTAAAIMVVLAPYTTGASWAPLAEAVLAGSLLVLAGVGLGRSRRTGHARADWALAALTVLFLCLAIVALNRPFGLGAVTGPWYGNSVRLGSVGSILLLVLAARGAALLLASLHQTTHPERRPTILAGLSMLALLAPVLAVSQLEHTLRCCSVFSPDDQRAAQWIARRISPGARVLGDRWGPVGWYYAQAGVLPLYPGRDTGPGFAQANMLTEQLLSPTGPDRRGLASLRELRVEYVVATPRTTLPTRYRLLAVNLDRLPWLRKVHAVGDVTIYRVAAPTR